MSIHAVVWAQDHAPYLDDDPSALSVLVAYARSVDEHGRGAWPDIDTLAKRTRLSDRTVQRKVDKLLKLGLIREGNQALAAHLPANNRPMVVDVVMDLRREPPPDRRNERKRAERQRKRGDTVTPLRLDGDRGDTSDRGDSTTPLGVTPSPNRGDSVTDEGCHRVTQEELREEPGEDQREAAAGDEIDHPEGEGDAADSVRELLALLGQRPDPESSWWTPAQAALARGGTPRQIASHVNHTPGARDPDRVRRVKLRDWPGVANGTSPTPARALEQSEQPPEPPPAGRTGPPGSRAPAALGDSLFAIAVKARGPMAAMGALNGTQGNGYGPVEADTSDQPEPAATDATEPAQAASTAALLDDLRATLTRNASTTRAPHTSPHPPRRPDTPDDRADCDAERQRVAQWIAGNSQHKKGTP